MRIEELLDRAMAASQGGSREEARDLLVDVLALEPGNLEAWLRLGELAASPERAALYYQRAAAIDPRSLRAQRGLEEARARLEPHRGSAAQGPVSPRVEREPPSRPAPVSPAGLPPDVPIFVDSEAAPFSLDLGGPLEPGKAEPSQRGLAEKGNPGYEASDGPLSQGTNTAGSV